MVDAAVRLSQLDGDAVIQVLIRTEVVVLVRENEHNGLGVVETIAGLGMWKFS